jgi:hypothetical protein
MKRSLRDVVPSVPSEQSANTRSERSPEQTEMITLPALGTLLNRDLIFILDDAATELNGDANSIRTDEA